MLLVGPALAGAPVTTIAQFGREPGTGSGPVGPLVADSSGPLYGATTLTTGSGFDSPGGDGTVFRLTPPAPGETFSLTPPKDGATAWTKANLHAFGVSGDSVFPSTLMGTAERGFYGAAGDPSVILKLKPPGPGQTDWSEIILHRFTGKREQGNGAVLPAPGRVLYGAAYGGGVDDLGTIFALHY